MIAILPEVLILFGAIHLFALKNKFNDLASKKVFNISKLYLCAAFVLALFLYNQNILADYLTTNPRRMLLKTMIYIYSIIWYSLSSRWFASKNESGIKFATFGLIQIACILFLISINNLYAIAITITILSMLNYQMLLLKKHIENILPEIKAYKNISIALNIMFWIGLIIIDYHSVIAMFLMLPILLFLTGIAPFHTGFISLVGKSILPVSGLCANINTLGCLLIFHILLRDTYVEYRSITTPILEYLGIISLFVGAIYATIQTNIRKILAYSSVFHVGLVIMLLATFSKDALFASFAYLIIYTISLFGIFCCFFGIKQNGIYQKNINQLNGVAHYNPFVIGCLMIFLISLAGFPPIIGFNARISAINFFITNSQFASVAIIVIALMILIYAYLNIIKSFYFLPETQKKYDRVDFGVYAVLLLNMVFMFTSIIHPTFIAEYIKEVINKL